MTAGPLDELAVYDRAADDGGVTGPTVVLVHGSMDRAASFIKVQKRLRHRHVVRYDRRGYARSSAAPIGGLDAHVADLLAIVGSTPAVVVGHSYGGLVALAAAATGAPAIGALAVFEAPMAWAPWWPRRRQVPTDADPAEVAAGFMRRVVGADVWEALPERTRAARCREGAALVAELGAVEQGRAPFDAGAIGVPVVVGYGSSTSEHLRRASIELAGLLADSRTMVIGGAGHGAHVSHPDEFTALVETAVAASGAAPTIAR